MNYRTMVKGALAFSLSLIVGSALAASTTYNDNPVYGATFESAVSTVAPLNDYAYQPGSGITNQTYRDEEAAKGWFAAAEDESKIIERVVENETQQALQLNTDANTLTNKFASDVAGAVNTALGNQGTAFFETEVKFVASDTLDAGIQGGQDATKFAIYAYSNDTPPEGENCTTNLVVFHAYYNGNGDLDYTNEVFDTLIDTEVYTKLRIEMTKKTNPANGQPVNVFSVKVGNSSALTSDTAFDAYIDENLDEGIWFLTVEDQLGGTATKNVSSLNFKGTGEIDNISVGTIAATTTYAIDWTGSENVVVSNGTEEVTGTTGDFADGTVLTFYPTVGLITNANDVALDPAAASWTYTVATADATFTVFAGEEIQPLDDNWTIVGLNPRGEWTDPTAVAADSKTLFYSNIVVNIDPIDATEGRSIVAAWIGARVVAPEAVTSANASQWTIGIGNATYTFDQIKESEGNFFNLWVPITAAKVRAAINANPKEDIVYTVEAYTDPSAKQTLSMVISPKDIEITNTGNVEGGETIDVDNWVEQSDTSDDYAAGDTVDGAEISAGMAAWLNGLKGNKTKEEFQGDFDSDGLSVYEEYLLNTDPTEDTTVSFTVSSIAVGATVDLQVTLTRTEGNEAVTAAINGELQILGATSLDGTFGNGEAVNNATFEGATTASTSLTTEAKFFKAVIVEKTVQAGE